MRIEVIHGRRLVCNHMFGKDELKVGQRWAPADGSNREVVIRELEVYSDGDVSVHYGEHGNDRTLEKDWFNFQCRYCLVLEDDQENNV